MNIAATELTLFKDLTAADVTLLLGALGTFLTTITGLFVQLRGLKHGQQEIHAAVNSNMEASMNRNDALAARNLTLENEKRESMDINLKMVPTDEKPPTVP